MEQLESFGHKLRTLRTKRGLSAKKLANIFKCSPSLIYNVEKDYNEPQPAFIVNVSRFFKVTSDYLLGIEDTRIMSEGDLLKIYRKLGYQERMVISYLLRLLGN